MHKQPIIKIENIKKSFKVGKNLIPVLKDINLDVFPDEFSLITGPSGCGKSTLLNTILGLEKPDSGRVLVENKDIYQKKEDQIAKFRHQKFGIVYQQSNWIRSLNVIENIAFPLYLSGLSEKKAILKAKEYAELFKVIEFEKYHPLELSGGQQQRVAIARALVTEPKIILADEPTGSLDSTAAADIMYAFKFLSDEFKKTIILVTHNPEYDSYATMIVKMMDGQIKSVKDKKIHNISEDEIKNVVQL